MKQKFLLPYGLKRIGWIILIPTAILGLMMMFDDFNGVPEYLYSGKIHMNINDPVYSLLNSETLTRCLNNIALIGTLIGLIFITCSRERVEDEMIGRIRLDALLLALYINTAVVIATALTVYDIDFLYVMIYNLFTLPLIFFLAFKYKLWRLRKEAANEE